MSSWACSITFQTVATLLGKKEPRPTHRHNVPKIYSMVVSVILKYIFNVHFTDKCYMYILQTHYKCTYYMYGYNVHLKCIGYDHSKRHENVRWKCSGIHGHTLHRRDKRLLETKRQYTSQIACVIQPCL
jgi:hypothetical protein